MDEKSATDRAWKMQAINLAAMEQLDFVGEYDFDKLFERARQIYTLGYQNQIHLWTSVWDESKHKVKVETPVKVQNKVETKTCPRCGEQVLMGWRTHSFKKDLTACGYVFE